MITPLADFPHNQIIAQAKISVADLDDNLRTTITDFNARYADLKRRGPEVHEAKIPTLMAVSTIISQNIYDYYVDKEDQEVTLGETPSLKEIKEVVKDIKEAEVIDNGELIIDNEKLKKTKELEKEAKKDTEPVITEPVITPAVEPQPGTPPVIIPDANIPTNPNEKALYLLHKEGIVEGISRAKLKEYGFDISSWGPLGTNGCKVGGYRVHKEFSEHVFKLVKN